MVNWNCSLDSKSFHEDSIMSLSHFSLNWHCSGLEDEIKRVNGKNNIESTFGQLRAGLHSQGKPICWKKRTPPRPVSTQYGEGRCSWRGYPCLWWSEANDKQGHLGLHSKILTASSTFLLLLQTYLHQTRCLFLVWKSLLEPPELCQWWKSNNIHLWISLLDSGVKNTLTSKVCKRGERGQSLHTGPQKADILIRWELLSASNITCVFVQRFW